MKNKNLLIILMLIFIIIIFAYLYMSQSSEIIPPYPSNNRYIAGLEWHHFPELFQIAQQENKPIAMYFWAIWCEKCAKFQTDILGNKDINEILGKDFILVLIDLDINRDVMRKYNVSYPPYVLFLDRNDRVLERVNGTVDADTFLNLTTQVKEMGHLK